MDSSGGISKLAALSEAVRHLEAQTLQLESQLFVPLGDFDVDVSVRVSKATDTCLASAADSIVF